MEEKSYLIMRQDLNDSAWYPVIVCATLDRAQKELDTFNHFFGSCCYYKIVSLTYYE